MVQRSEGNFLGRYEDELFYQVWETDQPRGTLVVTHGLAEHSECYNAFATTLAQENWTVVGWDLRGHGRSAGKRGYVAEFSDFIEDHKIFTDIVKKEVHKEGPMIAFGHSLGGLVTLTSLINSGENGYSAVSLSAPALGIAVKVPILKEKLANFASQWLPRLTLHNELSYADLVRDEEMIKSYESDPLRHYKISPKIFLGMLDWFERLKKMPPKLSTPVFLQLAGQDRIVSTPDAKKFFDTLDVKKKLKVYDDSFHEIFNDLDRQEAFSDIKEFLNEVK